jgi:hypothetical protein
VKEELAMQRKSKVTPTFLIVFLGVLLTAPTVYFSFVGGADHFWLFGHIFARLMDHVTNLTHRYGPCNQSDDPRRAFGRRHQLLTAGTVRVTNLTPGSGVTTLCQGFTAHKVRSANNKNAAARRSVAVAGAGGDGYGAASP